MCVCVGGGEARHQRKESDKTVARPTVKDLDDFIRELRERCFRPVCLFRISDDVTSLEKRVPPGRRTRRALSNVCCVPNASIATSTPPVIRRIVSTTSTFV